jgi:hypothetical protein
MQTSTEEGSRLKVRNWCLGTLLGVISISILCNLISDSIPNPINYVIRWITGEKDFTQAKLEVFLADKVTPLAGATVITERAEYDEFKNGVMFNAYMKNVGKSDTGPLRFTYYLDVALPKPEGGVDSEQKGFGAEVSGLIGTPTGGNLLPGGSSSQYFGLFFGESVEPPKQGSYKLRTEIRDTSGKLLYKGDCKIAIP